MKASSTGPAPSPRRGAAVRVVVFGCFLIVIGTLIERPYSTVLFAAAVLVLAPEAVRACRKWRVDRAGTR